MGVRLSTGCSARKKLGDISNSQLQQPKPGNQNIKQQPASFANKEDIDKFQKVIPRGLSLSHVWDGFVILHVGLE